MSNITVLIEAAKLALSSKRGCPAMSRDTMHCNCWHCVLHRAVKNAESQLEYVNGLEKRIEDMDAKLTWNSAVVAKLAEYEKRTYFHIYEIFVKEQKGEWRIWAHGFDKNDIFRKILLFKNTLSKFDDLVVTCRAMSNRKIILRSYGTDIPDLNSSKITEDAIVWKISAVRENAKSFNIVNIENYCTGTFFGYDSYDKLCGKSFYKYIKDRCK